MSPTRPIGERKQQRASDSRSAEKASPSATAGVGRDARHVREKFWRRSGGGGDTRGLGWQRVRGEGTARNGGGGGGGGGGRRRRRRGGREPAAHGAATMRTMPLVVLTVAACCVHRGPSFIPGVHADLRPQADLTSNCFNFPERNFDRDNCITAVNGGHTPYLPLETGGDAIDFTLHDLAGDPWSLQDALEDTGLPVVMVFGMWTCPAFQGYGTQPPWDMSGYWEERELVEAYKGQATFVHIYGPEPHPSTPGTNFDKGVTWQNYWSVLPQHKTYGERVAAAERIVDMIHPDQKILVDYLPGNPYSELIQPVWCSYSRGARPVTVITPDSKIFFQRGWFHSGHVAGAIEMYWCLQRQQQQEGQGQSERQDAEPDSGCLPSGGSDTDMGDGGSSPLAGVLPATSAASLPPWLR